MHLEEHIKAKKAIYERYAEGLKDLPITMNPFDGQDSCPNYWLSCILINPEAMCTQARGEESAVWRNQKGKSCPTEILEALSAFGAEGRPIWKPMHMQPLYRMEPFITRMSSAKAGGSAYGDNGKRVDVGADIFQRGLCLPSDIKMTKRQQDMVIDIIHRCFQ